MTTLRGRARPGEPRGSLSFARPVGGRGLIHSRPTSHAWGRDRMERGLIVVIGGVDSVDNCRHAAHDGESGWGEVRGPTVDDGQRDVGESWESPRPPVPAQVVHMLVRRLMWETVHVVGPGNPGNGVLQVVPAAEEGRRAVPTALSVDDIGRVDRVRGTHGYPQDCPQVVDLWTKRGRGAGAGGGHRRSRSGLSGRTGWGEACGQSGDA